MFRFETIAKVAASDTLIIFDNSRGLKKNILILSSLIDQYVDYFGQITRLEAKHINYD